MKHTDLSYQQKLLKTVRSRGFGFVEMESSSDAQNAIKALNESELSGRNITVNEAKEQRDEKGISSL